VPSRPLQFVVRPHCKTAFLQMDWLRLAERLLKLALPNTYLWLAMCEWVAAGLAMCSGWQQGWQCVSGWQQGWQCVSEWSQGWQCVSGWQQGWQCVSEWQQGARSVLPQPSLWLKALSVVQVCVPVEHLQLTREEVMDGTR
jgi:hypothetical protein